MAMREIGTWDREECERVLRIAEGGLHDIKESRGQLNHQFQSQVMELSHAQALERLVPATSTVVSRTSNSILYGLRHGHDMRNPTSTPLPCHQSNHRNRVLHRRALAHVEMIERGLTLRSLLWLPMVQQSIKLFPWIVSGASGTKSVACVFIASFLLFEFIHFHSKHRLTDDEVEEALDLMADWDEDDRGPSVRNNTVGERSASGKTKAAAFYKYGTISTTFATVLNIIAFGAMFNFQVPLKAIFKFSLIPLWPINGPIKIWNVSAWKTNIAWWRVVLILPGLTAVSAVMAIHIILFCVALLWLFWKLMLVHRNVVVYLARIVMGKLSPTMLGKAFVLDIATANCVGLETSVIGILWFSGLGVREGFAYDCAGTWKCGWYDWLG
ncbi:hypothetical protein VTL71DRAFT_1983 [Oculimacula yallundae]|uniref:Uncharacterized protein n=1 Tax=Oculimacula yallundae TaxID=86028 RepID=A0ABR4CC69_9HELO